MTKAATGASISVRQVRSGTGYAKDQKATLKALGLGRVGKTRNLPDNPQVRGMIGKVSHLVQLVEKESTGDAGRA